MALGGILPDNTTTIFPIDQFGVPDVTELLTFDCVENESPVDASAVTELPVEQGADITDHVQVKPTEVTLNVIHSNVDITGLVAFVPNPLPPTRAQDMYFKLLDWKNKAQLLTVITPHVAYVGMLITNITPNWDPTNSGAFAGAITLRAVVMASTDLVDVANVSNGAPGALKKRGPQKPPPATPAENESALHVVELFPAGGG